MNKELINFALGSLLRLGKAGNAAMQQYARDRKAIFPDLIKPKPDMTAFVTGFFAQANREEWVKPGTAPYAEYWTSTGPDLQNPYAVDALYIAFVKIRAEEGVDISQSVTADSDAAAGMVMIEQWADDNEPVGPLARVLVTVTDIALEYVARDPSIIGIDGPGEKLLAAFAQSLSEALPDDGKFGPRHRFTERLFATALRAGLESVAGNSEILVDEEHVRELLDKSLKPVIDSLPDDIDKQIDFKRTLEAISGPALSAAFGTIAEHPEAFLGSDFSSTRAIGAVAQAVLKEAADPNFANIFNGNGLVRIYQAALGVAAQRPELFIGRDGGNEEQIAKQLIAGFAAVLQDPGVEDAHGIGPQLGVVILEVVQSNVHLYLEQDKQWEKLASDLLQNILVGLQASVLTDSDDPLGKVFSRQQLVSLARIILDQVAATPSMIVHGNAEVSRLVGMIASLVAADEALLLTAEDWHEITKTLVMEAAANPGRLFDLDGSSPDQILAEELIGLVLKAAADHMNSAGRDGGAVLFGRTLREAIVIVITTTSGNPADAKENIANISLLVDKLSGFVEDHKDRMGSKEWLAVFRQLLMDIMSGEAISAITMDTVDAILAGGTP